jgi:hypothetical protein
MSRFVTFPHTPPQQEGDGVRRFEVAFTFHPWALHHNLTAYDAAYVALAETLAVPRLTCDQRLGQAPGLATTIEVVQ